MGKTVFTKVPALHLCPSLLCNLCVINSYLQLHAMLKHEKPITRKRVSVSVYKRKLTEHLLCEIRLCLIYLTRRLLTLRTWSDLAKSSGYNWIVIPTIIARHYDERCPHHPRASITIPQWNFVINYLVYFLSST